MERVVGDLAGLNDSELIRASRGDPGAFAVLFERHAVALRGWLFAQVGDTDIAHDLLAETFAQAWRSRARFRGREDGEGSAWLYGIARHLVSRHYRRGRVDRRAREQLGICTEARDDGGLEELPARLDARDLSPAVRMAFAELTATQQRAIGYRVVEGLDYAQIAAQLDCSAVTARSHVFRGLKTLRTALNKGVRA